MMVLSRPNRDDLRADKLAFRLQLAFIRQHLKHFAKICSQFVKRCALGMSTGYARHITHV